MKIVLRDPDLTRAAAATVARLADAAAELVALMRGESAPDLIALAHGRTLRSDVEGGDVPAALLAAHALDVQGERLRAGLAALEYDGSIWLTHALQERRLAWEASRLEGYPAYYLPPDVAAAALRADDDDIPF